MPAAKSKVSAVWDALQPWIMAFATAVVLPAVAWSISTIFDLRQAVAVQSERQMVQTQVLEKQLAHLERQDTALLNASVQLAALKESIDGLRKLRDVDHP